MMGSFNERAHGENCAGHERNWKSVPTTRALSNSPYDLNNLRDMCEYRFEAGSTRRWSVDRSCGPGVLAFGKVKGEAKADSAEMSKGTLFESEQF